MKAKLSAKLCWSILILIVFDETRSPIQVHTNQRRFTKPGVEQEFVICYKVTMIYGYFPLMLKNSTVEKNIVLIYRLKD